MCWMDCHVQWITCETQPAIASTGVLFAKDLRKNTFLRDLRRIHNVTMWWYLMTDPSMAPVARGWTTWIHISFEARDPPTHKLLIHSLQSLLRILIVASQFNELQLLYQRPHQVMLWLKSKSKSMQLHGITAIMQYIVWPKPRKRE